MTKSLNTQTENTLQENSKPMIKLRFSNGKSLWVDATKGYEHIHEQLKKGNNPVLDSWKGFYNFNMKNAWGPTSTWKFHKIAECAWLINNAGPQAADMLNYVHGSVPAVVDALQYFITTDSFDSSLNTMFSIAVGRMANEFVGAFNGVNFSDAVANFGKHHAQTFHPIHTEEPHVGYYEQIGYDLLQNSDRFNRIHNYNRLESNLLVFTNQ